MALTQLILHNFFSFVFIISAIVFIHEFGHFFVARLCGVKVEEFAIGMGKELFGFNDKKGTRWKFCLLPIGGYVKMFGDRNGASMPDSKSFDAMSKAEKKQSFLGKNVYQRAAIVGAGPIANFILAIFLFTALFNLNGLNTVLPIISEVVDKGAAFEAGLKKGDKILAINQEEVKDFNDLRQVVAVSADKELVLKIERGAEIIEQKVTPRNQMRLDIFGEEVKLGTIGVIASETLHQDLNFGQSFVKANQEVFAMTKAVFKALGELVTGKRSIEEMGGTIKIAQYSGKSVEAGITMVLWFAAMISINLGVMNLLPVPVLDGGHLCFYLIEAIRGKPLSQKTQEIAFRVGFSFVLTLMLFTTFNDVRQIFFK